MKRAQTPTGLEHPKANPTVEVEIRKLSRRLRSYGLRRSAVENITGDLRVDLNEAIATGGTIESVLGTNLDAFAAEVAEAHGRAAVPGRFVLISLSLAAPLLAVAFVTYVWIAGGGPVLGLEYHSITFTSHETTLSEDGSSRTAEVGNFPSWTPLAVYALATTFGVSAAFGLMALVLRIARDSRIGPTVWRLMMTMPVGGIVGITGSILLGAATNYSTRTHVIAAECMVAGALVVVSIVVGREWARRLPRERIQMGARPFRQPADS